MKGISLHPCLASRMPKPLQGAPRARGFPSTLCPRSKVFYPMPSQNIPTALPVVGASSAPAVTSVLDMLRTCCRRETCWRSSAAPVSGAGMAYYRQRMPCGPAEAELCSTGEGN
eukprot:scaffold7075_cov274-Pinguiococcus_pyrenoidosus.AAC.2